jgi:maltooligosyltrehalose trehalohydrolase
VEVVFEFSGRVLQLEPVSLGYHRGVADDAPPRTRYRFRLDEGEPVPDPASRSQPEGVHGPSAVVDTSSFSWTDDGWFGLPLRDLVIYELHVGTFTPEGTFRAVIPRLDELRDLGVTAVELMPVAQFPGRRGWGYDGVFPFAAHDSYGGPEALAELVDQCHRRGIAAVLDVVYNHLGPEGNHLLKFGPYFTDRYRTPWGPAINLEEPGSEEVRRYFIENALRWFEEFRFDALRLDAVHGIIDTSARPFLKQLADAVRDLGDRLNRRLHLIAESDLNDARLITPPAAGGLGIDAQWSDDFHHALHAALTGEPVGYYRDHGGVGHVAKAFTHGFVFTGQYSEFFGCRRGNDPRGVPAERFVVCAQNHDQVGNRPRGERLSRLVDFEGLKLAAGTVLLAPFVPLLFMGEEYGEKAPFLYFVDHSDPKLVRAVRRGRRAEMAGFEWEARPPDPQDPRTFARSKLNHDLKARGRHATLLELYRTLILLRRDVPALRHLSKDDLEVAPHERERVLEVRRWHEGSGGSEALAVFNLGGEVAIALSLATAGGAWRKELDSAEERWGGPGTDVPATLSGGDDIKLQLGPWSFVLFVRERDDA